jgi:hypothetical protein
MTTLGWVGVGLLVGAVIVLVVEGALMAVWSTRVGKQTRALAEQLATERGLIAADVERLRSALEETRRLWQPYRRALRWLRHPLTIALIASYRRRAGVAAR